MTEIRPGRESDLDRLREIQRETLDEPWEGLLEMALDAPLSLIVLAEGTPIGYAVAIPGPEGQVYLPEIAIHPDRQREGHGSHLLQAVCVDLAWEGYEELRLTAQAADEAARGFYRANGFEAIDRLPDEYERGDGILFARSLE